MSGSNAFTHLLKEIGALLGRQGFVRAKHAFWISQSKNFALIDVQRSAKSTRERVVFTLNLGVWSDRIAGFMPSSSKAQPPAITECHWRERIGFLLPKREDEWWSITQVDDVEVVKRELAPALENVVIPVVLAHIGDEALRDEWLCGEAPGLTDMQRLMYLSIMLKEIGPHDALESVIAELKQQTEGKPAEATVHRHLQKLGFNV